MEQELIQLSLRNLEELEALVCLFYFIKICGLVAVSKSHVFIFKYLFNTGYVFVVHLCPMEALHFESLHF